MLEGYGAATAGYGVVQREPGVEHERVALPAIAEGARVLDALGACCRDWLVARP